MMKKSLVLFKVFAGFAGLCSLTACSGFTSISPESHRTLQIQRDWTVPSLNEENLAARKIHRSTGVLFQDLWIQANSLDGVTAVKTTTGDRVWKRKLPYGSEVTPALVKDRLFVPSNDGQIYCLHAATGDVLWSFATKSENIAEPLLEDGILYVQAGNNSVFALDAATGQQVWMYSHSDSQTISIRGGSRPLISKGLLYVGMSDGVFVALDAKTGKSKWEKVLNPRKKFRDIDCDAILDGELIFVFGYDHQIYALKATNGDIVWRFEKGAYGRGLIYGDRLIAATTDGKVVALEKTSGLKQWIYELPLSAGIASSPVLYKGTVAIGESQGALKFLDLRTGKELASYSTGRGIFASPLVDEKSNRIYVISGESLLYSFQVKWVSNRFL